MIKTMHSESEIRRKNQWKESSGEEEEGINENEEEEEEKEKEKEKGRR